MPAIRSHSTETSERPWSASVNERRARSGENSGYYAKLYAWRDPDGEEGVKASYKFPHHFVSDAGEPGAASTRASSAIIAVLNGGRGGANIPDGDRRGIYNHAARHLRDAGKEVPELKHEQDAKNTEYKNLSLELKTLQENGTFEGLLSPYNEIDGGKDLVEPGAFTKTIQENGGRVPLLWQHRLDAPIGTLELKDSEEGLRVKGTLELGVQRGKEAYTLLKNNVVNGLSIGYRAIQKEMKDGVRRLREIKLFEGSIVTIPLAPSARVSAVKADFDTEFGRIRTLRALRDAMEALDSAIWSTVWDQDMDAAAKEDRISQSISDFHDTLMDLLPEWFDLLGMKAEAEADRKTGHSPNEATCKRLKTMSDEIQEILAEAGKDTGRTPAADATSESKPEPEVTDTLHSDDLTSFRDALVEALRDLAA